LFPQRKALTSKHYEKGPEIITSDTNFAYVLRLERVKGHSLHIELATGILGNWF